MLDKIETEIKNIAKNGKDDLTSFGSKIENGVSSIGSTAYRGLRDIVDVSAAGLIYHIVTDTDNKGLDDTETLAQNAMNYAGKTGLGTTINNDLNTVKDDLETFGKVILVGGVVIGGFFLYQLYQHRSQVGSAIGTVAKTGINLAADAIPIPGIRAPFS